jgi:cytochrome oxidase Cu insertion factor (SCO1/SenC/PrrC family)
MWCYASLPKSHKSYTVQHTASIYLIDPQGKFLDVFAINASTEAIITAMD